MSMIVIVIQENFYPLIEKYQRKFKHFELFLCYNPEI